jgi:dienelactone hydrolase
MRWTIAAIVLACAMNVLAAIRLDTVAYEAGGVSMQGTLVYDDAAAVSRPGVVVFPEIWGANDYAKSRGRMLAESGYVAFVADMYGGGKTIEDPKEAFAIADAMYAQPKVIIDRAIAAVTTLRTSGKADPQRIAAIGYCMGGGIALNVAFTGADLKTVVAFHANLVKRVTEMGQIKASILVLNGAADKLVSPQETQDFITMMQAANAKWELVLLRNAMHSYTNPNSDKYKALGTVGYDASADKRSWQLMLTQLDDAMGYKHIAAGSTAP